MDLDPGPGVDWPEVIEAAGEVRRRLGEAGLASFVKTSGGKVLHVVPPLKPRAGRDHVTHFANSRPDPMAAYSPESFAATAATPTRKGRILIAYLRNGRGTTPVPHPNNHTPHRSPRS